MRCVASLLLVLALAGCTTVPQVIREIPPADLIEDCPAVEEDITTNGGLVRTILDYREALARCSNEKAALREWVRE